MSPDKQRSTPYWYRPVPGLFWHTILSRSRNDASGLRRWQLWIWWSHPRSFSEWITTFRDLMTFPLDILLGAIRTARLYGRKVKHEHCIPIHTQLKDMLVLRIKSKLPFKLYYQLQLFLPDRKPAADQFFFETGKLFQVLSLRFQESSDFQIFLDKRMFASWCIKHGFPSVKTLAEFADNNVVQRCSPEPFPPIDLISKSTNWEGGKGVELWRHHAYNGISSWTNGTIEARSSEELASYIASTAARLDRPFVLQPFLTNHPVVRAMGNGSLCTLRIMTISKQERSAEILLVILRIPTGTSATDNFDTGGLAAPVDIQSGNCGKAVYKKDGYPVRQLELHPDTGEPIFGQPLPYLTESMNLVLRAHNTLSPKWPVIGWDVAILDDGPVLVEANNMPCPAVAQIPTGIPLGSTRFVDCLLDQMRTSFHV